MEAAGTEPPHGVAVFGSRIPHVALEAEAGMTLCRRTRHEAIAGHLRHHRRRSDRGAATISPDDPAMRRCARTQVKPVDEARRRRRFERRERSGQQVQVRDVQAVAIDGSTRRGHHRHLLGIPQDRVGQLVAHIRRNELRVVQPAKLSTRPPADSIEIEDDSRRNEGTRQAPPTRLVGSGHQSLAQPPIKGEEPQSRRSPAEWCRSRHGGHSAHRSRRPALFGLQTRPAHG